MTCQIVPSGPGFPNENNLRLFNTLIYGAQHRLSITSPYFVPEQSLLYAITTAAQRGVAVELFVGAEGDQFMVYHAQCSYYRPLLEAGVRIYLYPAPFVLHAKHFSVDDHTAVIGSSNMDIRSFSLDFEISMMCHRQPGIRQPNARSRRPVPIAVPRTDPSRMENPPPLQAVARQRHAPDIRRPIGRHRRCSKSIGGSQANDRSE